MTVLVVVLLAGWAAQAVSWVVALGRVRGGAATRGEWVWEVALRVVITALVAATVVGARGRGPSLGRGGEAAAVALFLAGQALAVAGRQQLGRAWGIGTAPREGAAPPVLRGLYARVRHPIYIGTATAVLAQALLLGNLPSLLLVAGSLVVIPLKIRRENRWIRERHGAAE